MVRRKEDMNSMARIRTIKPEFWDDEKLASIQRDARLLFIGLWNFADDYGVVKGHPVWLKNRIFPYDDIKQSTFNEWLAALARIRVIVPFSSGGEQYYYIRNFRTHQKINRPSDTRNPEPPEEIIQAVESGTYEPSSNTHAGLTEPSLSPHGLLTEDSPPPHGGLIAGKEREREGKSKPPLPPLRKGGNGFSPPDWVPRDAWDAFIESRKRQKGGITERAKELIVLQLDKLRQEGHDPEAVLNQSVAMGWKGVFPIRDGPLIEPRDPDSWLKNKLRTQGETDDAH